MKTSIFRHNSYISWIIFMLFVFSYFLSCDSLHCIDLTLFYLFIITTVFSFVLIYALSFTYPVTVCCFPKEIISLLPPLPIKLLSRATAYCLIRIYCPVAQWFWFSASKTMQCLFVTLIRCVNGQWNELWHQSINKIFLFQAKSLD